MSPRADRINDVEDGLSEMPRIILSQARLHDFYPQVMAAAPTRLTPDNDRELVSLTRHGKGVHPLKAVFKTAQGQVSIRANMWWGVTVHGQPCAAHRMCCLRGGGVPALGGDGRTGDRRVGSL